VPPIPLPIEMRARPARKVSLVLGWIFLMVCGVITVLSGGLVSIIGLFGLAFFGYAGIKLFRQRSDLAGLVLTVDGVRPVGWSTSVPWAEITQVGVGKFAHNKLVGFNVADYDRLIAAMTPEDLRALRTLRATLKPLSATMRLAGQDPGALPDLAAGELKDTFAACRRQIGWDLIAMQTYLDRPVEQAAELLEAVRRQQSPPEQGLPT
jgi:hypothetical protein